MEKKCQNVDICTFTKSKYTFNNKNYTKVNTFALLRKIEECFVLYTNRINTNQR